MLYFRALFPVLFLALFLNNLEILTKIIPANKNINAIIAEQITSLIKKL